MTCFTVFTYEERLQSTVGIQHALQIRRFSPVIIARNGASKNMDLAEDRSLINYALSIELHDGSLLIGLDWNPKEVGILVELGICEAPVCFQKRERFFSSLGTSQIPWNTHNFCLPQSSDNSDNHQPTIP
jgi:hypothetical protein